MASVLIVWSSLTGNTRRVAEAIHAHLGSQTDIRSVDDTAGMDLAGYDLIILCYWCWRGTVDLKTRAFTETLSGRQIAMVGTLGAYDTGTYADRVWDNARAVAEEKNSCHGNFLCRGKINPARTEARRKLPPGERHYLDDEGYRRHLSSHPHPTPEDLSNACRFVDALLENSDQL